MERKPRQLELVVGDDVYVVAARDQVAPAHEYATARALVERLAREGGASTLERLAEDLVPFPPRSFEHALEIVVDAIASGRVVAVRMDASARLYDDETDIVDIHDLIDPEEREGGDRRIDPVEPALTWLSFEVVDERGRRLDGSYVCTIDGSPDEAALVKETHEYEDLRVGAQARLELRFLDLFEADEIGPDQDADAEVDPLVPVTPDGGADGDSNDADYDPDPAGQGVTTLEVVDADGGPWVGEYEIAGTGVGEGSGSLGGRIELGRDLAGPITVALRELRMG